jgi:hypothetical protein
MLHLLLLLLLQLLHAYLGPVKGDQIGRIFAQWAIVYSGQLF